MLIHAGLLPLLLNFSSILLGTFPYYYSKKIPEEGKVSCPEAQVGNLYIAQLLAGTELLDLVVTVVKASPSAHISRLSLLVTIRSSSTYLSAGSSITCYCLFKCKDCGEKKVTGFILFLPECKI